MTLDMSLPDMHGSEVVEQGKPSFPVIPATGNILPSDLAMYSSLGLRPVLVSGGTLRMHGARFDGCGGHQQLLVRFYLHVSRQNRSANPSCARLCCRQPPSDKSDTAPSVPFVTSRGLLLLLHFLFFYFKLC